MRLVGFLKAWLALRSFFCRHGGAHARCITALESMCRGPGFGITSVVVKCPDCGWSFVGSVVIPLSSRYQLRPRGPVVVPFRRRLPDAQ